MMYLIHSMTCAYSHRDLLWLCLSCWSRGSLDFWWWKTMPLVMCDCYTWICSQFLITPFPLLCTDP